MGCSPDSVFSGYFSNSTCHRLQQDVETNADNIYCNDIADGGGSCRCVVLLSNAFRMGISALVWVDTVLVNLLVSIPFTIHVEKDGSAYRYFDVDR